MSLICFGELGGVRSCWGYRLKLVRNQQENDYKLPKNVRVFSYKSLQKATYNFGTLIGKGGFSSCYKGTLENGTIVAVKVLEKFRSQDSDFFELIMITSRVRHRNVVEFIGYCVENDHRIVVYEFVGDYSLDQFLFDPVSKRAELSWPMRASICLGIARGLEYLHHGISPRVVNRDIKPRNVLLDANFNPKIGDFEIARLFDDDLSHCSGSMAGTIGFMDPEYAATGRFTEKADVYSFGVLLLEVISGRKNVQIASERGITLLDLVWELRESDRVLEIVDPNLFEFPKDELVRFINVALFCVQIPSNLRPSMSEVLLMLSGGYDFSKKVLTKPQHYSGTYDELNRSDYWAGAI